MPYNDYISHITSQCETLNIDNIKGNHTYIYIYVCHVCVLPGNWNVTSHNSSCQGNRIPHPPPFLSVSISTIWVYMTILIFLLVYIIDVQIHNLYIGIGGSIQPKEMGTYIDHMDHILVINTANYHACRTRYQ